MRKYRLPLIVGALFALVPSAAYSQEPPKAGIVTGYPAAIGIIVHVSKNVAIRPDVSFSWSSSDNSAIADVTYKTTRVGTGFSALFYYRSIDNLKLYVSPRISYTRTHATNDSSTIVLGSSTTTSAFQPAGMFGAQYSLHRRFAIYGEAGAGYARSTSKGHSTTVAGLTVPTEQKARSWGTMTGVGVIVYF